MAEGNLDAAYRLPAEFERHAVTYLLWPTRPDNWRDAARYAQSAFLQLAELISKFEPVRLGCSNPSELRNLPNLPNRVEPIYIDYNDVWVRDTGPTILVEGARTPVAVDWKFNSWGGLFDESAEDDAVARRIADLEGIPTIRAPIVLEGGSIATDGARTLIVTEESVLNTNRNPGLTKHDAEVIFDRFLGIRKTIWLERGLANDEAGGHIDNVCAFSDARTLLVSDTNDRDHPSFERVTEIKRVLSKATNLQGQLFEILPLRLPPPATISDEEAAGFQAAAGTIQRSGGTPLAPSYCNLYVANGAVVVPTFGEDADELALETVRTAFPDRKIVPFPSRELLLGGGAIHCVTRDVPKYN